MDLTVIIPTYNRASKILQVLNLLDTQDADEFSYAVHVMNDGSTDGTEEVLKSYRPRNYSFKWGSQKNAGAGAARNRLLQWVETDLVVIIGDDITPVSDFLKTHRDTHILSNNKKLAVLGKTVWHPQTPITTVMSHIDGVGAQQFSYHYLKNGEYYDYRHFYTSNISIRTDFIRSLGTIFRPEFPGAAFEDIELGYRLEKEGMRILYKEDALAFHDHFYSVRGFCRRQFNCGIAAKVFVGMHPEVGRILSLPRFKSLRRQAFVPWNHYANQRFLSLFGSIETFEEKILRILSAYESLNIGPLLDEMYINLFNYYYFKGITHANLEGWLRESVINIMARKILWPSFNKFVYEAMKGSIPFPQEEVDDFCLAFRMRAHALERS